MDKKVMTDRQREIARRFVKVLPDLSDRALDRLSGIAEGLEMATETKRKTEIMQSAS